MSQFSMDRFHIIFRVTMAQNEGVFKKWGLSFQKWPTGGHI